MTSRPYGLMLKTVSEDCNLACEYCYYSRVKGRPQSVRKPTHEVLRKLLADYLQTCGPVASIAWQGGEPLLAGLPFFQQVVAWEAAYAAPGTIISNALQTNGTLLTPEWARFLAQYRFLVGVSIDGPREIHDLHRVAADGHGSFDRVMRGIDHLRRARTEFNVLTVVGSHNVHRAAELFGFYESEDFRWVQFIPQMAFMSQSTTAPGTYAITPADYAQFLCTSFDRWYNNGAPRISIRDFDNILLTYAHRPSEMCTMRKECPRNLVLESSGDIFPCDFFLDAPWKLGNVLEDPLVGAFRSPVYHRFQEMKPQLPQACRRCRWIAQCRGGCPRTRSSENSATPGVDYFCSAFREFFAYSDERFRRLAEKV